MPFLRSRFVDQGSDYHFSHDFPAFSPFIMGPSQGAISAVPFRLSRLGLSLSYAFSCNFALILRPILGAIPAAPFRLSRLGLSFLL